MPTVAEQLHQAREAKHLTVQQIADITKLRTDHVRALEEGDYDVFCAPVYIRGFVRTYSTLLKLDVPQVMATLDSELRQTRNFAEPPALSNEPKGVLDFLMLQLSQIDWRKGVIVLGTLIVLAGLAVGALIWRHYQHTDPLKDLQPGMYKPAQTGETLPLPSSPKR